MTNKTELIEIGILCYPDAQLAAIHGLTDLFLIAERLQNDSSSTADRHLRVSHWQLKADQTDLECNFDSHPKKANKPNVIILPPSLSENTPDSQSTSVPINWLKKQHNRGATLCSVCAGAFLLGETGLLDGRTITTHWSFSDQFMQRFPDTNLNLQKLIIDDGDIITAGGLMAWTDLGLNLIERFLGPSLTLKTARFLLVDPAGREQQYYRHFTHNFDHQDAAILRVQHILQANIDKQISVQEMAEIAHLEKRTFLRRFYKATGYKPVEYYQHLRIENAREKLELTSLSVEKIAWEVAYTDSSSFRRVFQKIVGLTPSEYRQRFGLASDN